MARTSNRASTLKTEQSRMTAHVAKAVKQASKPIVKQARLNVRLDQEVHEMFWRACKRNESDMTTVILEFIEAYNAKNSL